MNLTNKIFSDPHFVMKLTEAINDFVAPKIRQGIEEALKGVITVLEERFNVADKAQSLEYEEYAKSFKDTFIDPPTRDEWDLLKKNKELRLLLVRNGIKVSEDNLCFEFVDDSLSELIDCDGHKLLPLIDFYLKNADLQPEFIKTALIGGEMTPEMVESLEKEMKCPLSMLPSHYRRGLISRLWNSSKLRGELQEIFSQRGWVADE